MTDSFFYMDVIYFPFWMAIYAFCIMSRPVLHVLGLFRLEIIKMELGT